MEAEKQQNSITQVVKEKYFGFKINVDGVLGRIARGYSVKKNTRFCAGNAVRLDCCNQTAR